MSLKDILPLRLKLMRGKYGIPADESAGMCRVSHGALLSWEEGLKCPRTDNLFNMATAYGVSVDWLCGIGISEYPSDAVEHAEWLSPPTRDEIRKAVALAGKELPDGKIDGYLDKEKRRMLYPEWRADILACISYTRYLGTLEKTTRLQEKRGRAFGRRIWEILYSADF